MAKSKEAIEHNLELHRESYRWYTGNGICWRCKTAYAEPGRIYCKSCKRRIHAMQERRDPGRVKRNAYNAERRARLKAAGLCVECGKIKAVEGKTRCFTCERKIEESRQKWEITQKIKKEMAQREQEIQRRV